MGVIRYGRTAQIGVYPGNQSGNLISYRSGFTKPPLGADTTLWYKFDEDKSLEARIGPTLTCTRASEATYYDSAGVLQTAAANEPRFDHDPATGESLGLLIEESRTNEVTNSDDPTQWLSPVNATLNRNQLAPDGTNNATLITDDATSGTHHVGTVQHSFNVSAARTVYVKRGTARYCYISSSNTPETNTFQHTAIFDFDTETFTEEGTLLTSPATFKKLSNGYYALTIVIFATGSTTNRITVGIANGPGVADVVYSGVGDTLILWAGQYEQGEFATSYIPTTTASVTRSVDVVNESSLSWYDGAGGTFYVHASRNYTNLAATTNVFEMNDGGANNRFEIRVDAAENVNWFIRDAGVTQATLVVIDGMASNEARAACTLIANDFSLYVDGIAATPDTSGTVPTVTDLNLGSGQTFGEWNGHIKEFAYANVRLPNDELQEVTQP